MATTTITRKEITVPADLIVEVSAVIEANTLHAEIIGSDEDEDTVTLEVEYSREERSVVREIENLISDHEEDGDDDEDDDEEDEDA